MKFPKNGEDEKEWTQTVCHAENRHEWPYWGADSFITSDYLLGLFNGFFHGALIKLTHLLYRAIYTKTITPRTNAVLTEGVPIYACLEIPFTKNLD